MSKIFRSFRILIKNRLLSFLIRPVNGRSIGLISREPYIFLTSYSGDQKLPFSFLYLLATILIHRQVYWIFICTWVMKESNSQWLSEHISKFCRVFSKHHIILLANTESENTLLHKYGIWSIYCSHNAFIDEQIFHPKKARKKYRAIYNARILPYKRHFLAKEVQELALIGYLGKHEGDPKIKASMNNASWLNEKKNGKFVYFKAPKLNELLNDARVGLCLSMEEGAMYSSMEYLLVGLPIVTTYNLGGRDEFFDPEYVEWVDDNPSAVAEGVQKLINKNIDPDYIRRKTLDKVAEHRKRFISLIQSIFDENNINRQFEAEWDIIFFNKMQDSSLTWRKIFGSQKS